MATDRVFKKDPGVGATLVGWLAIIGGITGMLIFGVAVELDDMIALITICITLVWMIGGGYTYLMLATEPVQE